MLKYYCHSCGGWGVACHTTSPQGMIPPLIKRSRILVSGSVVIVISVKLYNKVCSCDVCGCAYPAGKFPCAGILRPKAKSGPVRSQQNRPSPREMLLRDKLPTFHFRLSLLLSLRSTVPFTMVSNLALSLHHGILRFRFSIHILTSRTFLE
jgi:hypothetical protein